MTVYLSVALLVLAVCFLLSITAAIRPFRPFASRGKALISAGSTFALCFGIALAVGLSAENGKTKSTSRADRAAAQTESSAADTTAERKAHLKDTVQLADNLPAPCGEGGAVINDLFAVASDYEPRVEPSTSSARLKNEKASAILEKVHYHVIDKSTTVRRLCVQKEWTQIQIVTPEWLTFVVGWVPNATIREIVHADDGKRLFVEDDVSWGKDTAKYKQAIVAVINRIHRENANCGHIDASSVAKSRDRSKPGDPVFYVTCGEGAGVFNVWFRPKDATSSTTFAARKPLGAQAATDACERAARNAATHPSTVSFSRLWDLAYVPHASGRATVLSTFNARNAFNLELKYRISCLFDGPDIIETLIAEASE